MQPSFEEGVERFRSVAGKVEVAYVAMRTENAHLKERISDLAKQLDFIHNNNDNSKNNDKERRRFEIREDQARRELEHVKREKERLVDKNSEMALALKQAHDELRSYSDEIDKLKEKINFYEKTFPLTITRHKKQFVPSLNLNSQ